MNLEISEEFIGRVEQLLKKSQGEKCKLKVIEPYAVGANNTCYYLVTKNPDNKFFLKCENATIMPRTRCGQIEREVEGIKLMNKAGIPCKKIIQYDFTKEEIDTRYVLEEFIEGELLIEIWNDLNESEKQNIANEIEDIVEKMRNINFSYYGDIYENSIIGKYATWREAYLSISEILIEDARQLNIFTENELALISRATEFCSLKLSTNVPSSFNHRDLGTHNVIAINSEGVTKVGAIIDFGLSLAVPFYNFDYGIRKYGGWNFNEIDVLKKYNITKDEFDATELLFDLELTVFLASIEFAPDKPFGYISRIKVFVESCKKYL
ncbi:phosphotransferase [Clostridium cellulovorans]|uniref:Aminoglycoside phosphotransferase n=1 Tax=Clostridium cellulovorans (strain ATCC 35296 / DSM 3052 / OCM 3 / 743B) TaxID=573061 RepID=D9SUZ8_CLOC7|nr:phosphotransferase [Clostridium cellulovorans]ADL52973.1 aminoglycoside phosphotransferase [Clostridium cellulovorans 743B]